MNAVIAWFARNPVAANLLLLVVMAGGLITAPRIKQEVFPEFSTDRIVVSVPYPAAAPEEIEQSINARIEERIGGLEGIKRITSAAAEGLGTITVEALAGVDVRELLNDVKSEVDAIDTLPEEAEEPVVRELIPRHEVITVAVYGDADEATLKRLGDRVRDEISTHGEVTQVELVNARPYEISIEISEEALRRHGLTFDGVAEAVRRSSLDLPAGSVKTEAGEVLLRTKAQGYVGRDFERIVLLTHADGTRLLLADVAAVVDAFADTDQAARFDAMPAVMVKVYRVGEQSALRIADAVKAYVAEAQARMPEGVRLTTWDDRTEVLRSRLHTLRNDALQGLVLVFVMLAIFLEIRIATWTTFGIPFSFLAAMWLMPALDVSINMLSLFSLILVLGIVVDDATVVGENVYKKREAGMSGLEAAIKGTQEVALPVVFGVLVTVAAFVPMYGLPGVMGKIMRVFPSVVIPTLLFSLIECQLAFPAHISHLPDAKTQPGALEARWKSVQKWAGDRLERFVASVYQPTLERALEWRYTVLAGGIGLLAITTAMLAAGFVRTSFFPQVEADNVVAALTMPRGTPRQVTEAALARLTAAAEKAGAEFSTQVEDGRAIRHVLTSLGEQPASGERHGDISATGSSGSHLGEVNIQLAPAETRSFGSTELARRWRELTGPIPDVVELTYSSSLFDAGDAIQIELSATDNEQLNAAAERLKEALGGYPGVFDVADSQRPGKQEMKLAIRPEAEALGLTLGEVSRQVRQAFYGEEAQRVQRGREDVKVMVRYPHAERRSLADVENMRVRTPDGGEIPFATVARVEHGRGYATIERADRRRIVTVSADVDGKTANANEVLAHLRATVLTQLTADYPGLRFELEGEQREQRETMGALGRNFLLALFVIFALLAVPLRSYAQPLIVMTAIPFGISGAVWAHKLLGMDLSFLSVFGIVALTGVVVNDSLVLVDYINNCREDGRSVLEAVRQAGAARFRPIMLVSGTTFIGLLPLLLERSLQAQFLVPMAVSLGFGSIFATSVSLIVVPCVYLILDDLRVAVRGGRGVHAHAAAEPALPSAAAADPAAPLPRDAVTS